MCFDWILCSRHDAINFFVGCIYFGMLYREMWCFYRIILVMRLYQSVFKCTYILWGMFSLSQSIQYFTFFLSHYFIEFKHPKMILLKVGKKNTLLRIIYVFEYVTIHNRFQLEEVTNGNNRCLCLCCLYCKLHVHIKSSKRNKRTVTGLC